MAYVSVNGEVLEYELLPARQPAHPTLVFLHEGLGSVAMWGDFPQRVAAATACRTLLWSRLGHGQSMALPTPRSPAYLHQEALQRLPALLAVLAIEKPLLIGHSDGASIALIYAAQRPQEVLGVVAMAPHEFVEEKALDGIRRAGAVYANSDWPEKLARYHRDPDAVFHAWHDTWLAPEFHAWDIRQHLPSIRCPVLAIQGEDDEYATMRQIECIAEQANAVELLKLAHCRHSPHRDQTQAVIAAITRFLARLSDTTAD